MAASGGAMGSYTQAGSDAALGPGHGHGHAQLSSQWSFSRQDLPQISEMGMIPADIGESIVGAGGCNSSSDAAQSSSYLSRTFSVGSWDDTNSIMFSSAPCKKPKVDPAAGADDMVTNFSTIDPQVSARRLPCRAVPCLAPALICRSPASCIIDGVVPC
jgi:hypothetical protein